MKKMVYLCCTLLCAAVLTARAEVIEGECTDTLRWAYDTELKSLTLTGRGPIPEMGLYNFPWNDYKAEVESLSLPDELSYIAPYAFHAFSRLQSVVIPNMVGTIDQYSFQDCVRLRSVSIGTRVTSIGSHAFAGCYSLTNLVIPANVLEVKYRAFADVPNVSYEGTNLGRADARCLNGVVDGPMVYENESRTRLAACSAIATGRVKVAETVTDINESAFIGCIDLTTVELSDQVSMVGKNAFSECDSLRTLIIGSGLIETNMYAFDAKGIRTVVCKALTPPDLGMNAFYSVRKNSATLYVPDESLAAYQTASQWEDFGTILPLSQWQDESEDLNAASTSVVRAHKTLREGRVIITTEQRTYTLNGQEITKP